LFILFIRAFTPVTLDGKKISFEQLAVGQRIQAQYNLSPRGKACWAYRVDAFSSSAPSHSDKSAKAKSKPSN
jgi:hypothetical protein